METIKPKCVYQEERWTRAMITIDNLPENFIHLQVNNHSKIRNMLGFAVKNLKEADHLVCSASGPSVNKAITCAEILKRQMPELRQITGIGYRNVRMIKEEIVLGEVSKTITTRRLPSIHILLSKNHLKPDLPGYQGADKLADHVNRPVPRKTYDKDEYRGTKESKIKAP
ncbi:ribonuclease P protein subunit p25 isoform X2 [Daktulosphaira vitifoliae]|uniref:ribonuclease P protein subunit p25 isoform X1 n=1 Tax=Daktulosphaira vitifoliae TaxID=58002 RepID=UPI0021AAD83C|nr:ribonuclease P protein subunit p25 isoform X1 [Daktulosphaira vitifoliae]XP_050537261.1 ribonuclease P protein subunit p25 isoform X1 [Daktulosphaira vitifoliae]XP_050537269.1 ribonuclease P protein subunit p25 isoform X2 [Daktulosphaira vitifoliae]